MRIPLTEPTAPRYISVNQKTNQVHLMVPVVNGEEISTDNTCKATEALRSFFDGGALRELNAYKNALEFDIPLLEASNPIRLDKEARLAQIEIYIEAVPAMRHLYGTAMTALMTRPSNLYGIQLRPRSQDFQSRVINPAFNIERHNDALGIPLSALYNAMHERFPTTVISAPDNRTRLTEAVLTELHNLPMPSSFTDIQRVLSEKFHQLFNLDSDFTQYIDTTTSPDNPVIAVNQAHMNKIMGIVEEDSVVPADYVNALLGTCAQNLWDLIPTPPFYSIQARADIAERTEHLSIITQFLLSIVNIYCRARGISAQNFGSILDSSQDLSNELVSVVEGALSAGDEVEAALCAFCNKNATELGLSRILNLDDMTAIKQKFERTYRTVTATKENPHMDDFLILDLEATGETAKFVLHQNSICTDFAEIVEPSLPNQDYFANIRADFAVHPAKMLHKNEWVASNVDLEPEVLMARITDEQFEELPRAVKVACGAHPAFQLRQFLHDVSKGRQDEADALLTDSADNQQILLRTPGIFTDYSGRTFNCTAYEYAYWAKDTHMCRMLERHMDDETKVLMLARIDEIERTDSATGQPAGLVYQQGGVEKHSAHFDLAPLISALKQYVDGYDNWEDPNNQDELEAAWKEVGIQQRDMPVHVLNEYCHPDRSFYPRPDFTEEIPPRNVKFSHFGRLVALFPLVVSNTEGLGVDFALFRSGLDKTMGSMAPQPTHVSSDLAAVSHLDTIRNRDLTRSRENLQAINSEPSHRAF